MNRDQKIIQRVARRFTALQPQMIHPSLRALMKDDVFMELLVVSGVIPPSRAYNENHMFIDKTTTLLDKLVEGWLIPHCKAKINEGDLDTRQSDLKVNDTDEIETEGTSEVYTSRTDPGETAEIGISGTLKYPTSVEEPAFLVIPLKPLLDLISNFLRQKFHLPLMWGQVINGIPRLAEKCAEILWDSGDFEEVPAVIYEDGLKDEAGDASEYTFGSDWDDSSGLEDPFDYTIQIDNLYVAMEDPSRPEGKPKVNGLNVILPFRINADVSARFN